MKRHATRGGNTAAEGNATTTRVTNDQKAENKQNAKTELQQNKVLKVQVENITSEEEALEREIQSEAYEKYRAAQLQARGNYQVDFNKYTNEYIDGEYRRRGLDPSTRPSVLKEKLKTQENGLIGFADTNAKIRIAKERYAEAMYFRS